MLSLFITAFLAATLLPMGSEWLLLLKLSEGETPLGLWLAATAGNSLGGLVNYGLGRFLHDWLERKGKTSGRGWRWAERSFQRWGVWSLLLAWVPVVGDPLTLLAGVLKAPLWLSALLITLGKAGRYALLIWGFQALA